MSKFFTIFFCSLFYLSLAAQDSVPSDLLDREFYHLALAENGHHATCESLQHDSWIVETTGTDPYVMIDGVSETVDPDWEWTVAFQYKAPSGVKNFQALYEETHTGLQHINSSLAQTNSWRWHFVAIPEGELIKWFRFDFGNHANRRIQIRDCRLIRNVPEFDVSKIDCLPFGLAASGNDSEIKKLPNRGLQITTTGNDSYINSIRMTKIHDPATPYIIAFEYQAPEDFGDIRFYYNTAQGMKQADAGVTPSDDWRWHLYDFSVDGKGIGTELKSFRMDFGQREGLQFKIRNCRLIKATRELRLRAAIGDKAEKVDQFGIALQDVAQQKSAVETVRHSDESSQTVVLSAYKYLDLDAETKRFADEWPLPPGPRIVAGEGEHPENHTVVRILSRYQVCETQFLAFPPEVKGGVGVDVDGHSIYTWPLASTASNQIRVFNLSGGLVRTFDIPAKLNPPFTVAVLSGRDEIAVASRYSDSAKPPVLIYSNTGELLEQKSFAAGAGSDRREYALLSTGKHRLLVQNLSRKVATSIFSDPAKTIDFSGSEAPVRLFDSVYSDRDFNLGGPEKTISTLVAWKEIG